MDAIKTSPPPHLSDLHLLIDGIGTEVAVLFSGGTLQPDDHLTRLAKEVAAGDARGLCVGRNVFQRPDPHAILAQLRQILDDGTA